MDDATADAYLARIGAEFGREFLSRDRRAANLQLGLRPQDDGDAHHLFGIDVADIPCLAMGLLGASGESFHDHYSRLDFA